MIAPLPRTQKTVGRARGKAVIRWFLPERDDSDPRATPLTGWKSWVLAAWMAVTAIVYLMDLLGEF